MRVLEKRLRYTRREMMKTSGAATFGAALVVSGGMVAAPDKAWAVEAKALKPQSMAALIQMARDIYPHDRLADRFYVSSVAALDAKAAKDKGFKAMMEDGVAGLDLAAQGQGAASYVALGWEIDRTDILRSIQSSAFFQAVKGNLVTGIYNNPEVWPLFGYEGESASKGGYLNRGFDDIDWL
jgi:hypothetical protein